MKAELKLDKNAHAESDLQEEMSKLEDLRERLLRARRVAMGLPQKTREQVPA
jgi:hypothetical protein